MLNPPLSLLSDDLLNYIVDHVAELPFSISNLYNLSITDRAFTRFCQAYIFKDLCLGNVLGTNKSISKKLAKIKNILNDEPSFANRVRTVHLTVKRQRNKWLFNDPDFITIIQLLAKSPMPPHELHLTGFACPFIIEDPILVVGRLMQSFFSRTLTVLNLSYCENVPLTLFLVCPNLREVYLDYVSVFESRDDEYPEKQCSGRELPALEMLNYSKSERLVKQMITPPTKLPMAVVDWSKLRVLKLCPHEEEDILYLQLILDVACNTLEELYLTDIRAWNLDQEHWQLSLAGLVDLRHLPNLHIFAIYVVIGFDAQEPVILRDINLVLSTIPKTNQVTKLSLYFIILVRIYPFDGCLEEDWVGMCDEAIRISAGKPLDLNLEMSTIPLEDSDEDELCERIKEKIAAFLSDYPNIRTHFWHPHSET